MNAAAPDSFDGRYLLQMEWRALAHALMEDGPDARRARLADLFGDVFHIESGDLIPKPDPRTFEAIVTRFDVDPTRTAFFEDTPRNLKPAADLGMTTVLIGPHALASQAPFVHHRAEHLTPFLESLSLAEPADHD